jgi:hypothetical protein
MKAGKRVVPIALLTLLVSACSSRESRLDPLADQLSAAVNRCVTDVRDRGLKYEASDNCHSLGGIAKQYIAASSLYQLKPKFDKKSAPGV